MGHHRLWWDLMSLSVIEYDIRVHGIFGRKWLILNCFKICILLIVSFFKLDQRVQIPLTFQT